MVFSLCLSLSLFPSLPHPTYIYIYIYIYKSYAKVVCVASVGIVTFPSDLHEYPSLFYLIVLFFCVCRNLSTSFLMTRKAPDRYTDRDTHVIKKRAGRRPSLKQMHRHTGLGLLLPSDESYCHRVLLLYSLELAFGQLFFNHMCVCFCVPVWGFPCHQKRS